MEGQASGAVQYNIQHKSQHLSHQPEYEYGQSYTLKRMTNCTIKKLQPLLVVVIVEQTPASATDRPAGPWEDFHATPGGTVNYPAR